MAERGMNQRQHAAHRKALKRNQRDERAPGDRGIRLQDTQSFQRAQRIHEGVQDAESKSERRGMTAEELRQHRKTRSSARRT